MQPLKNDEYLAYCVRGDIKVITIRFFRPFFEHGRMTVHKVMVYLVKPYFMKMIRMSC
jgi:hypothetical protein